MRILENSMYDQIFLKQANGKDPAVPITRFQDRGPIQIQFPKLKKERLNFSHTKFFAIGSCFAKNLANFLRAKGYYVSPYYFDHNFIERLGNPMLWLCGKVDQTPWDKVMIGHFDPMHIYQDLKVAASIIKKETIQMDLPIWSLNSKHREFFLPKNLKYMSPLHTKVYGFSKEHVKSIEKRIYMSLAEALRQSDIFIITYGLAEYLKCIDSNHIAVNSGGTASQKDKCAAHLMNSNEISEVLIETVKLIKSININATIFFSLSPVRLASTSFTSRDVYQMGTLGKALLRTGIEDGIKKVNSIFDQCVYYIPSYEYVTLGNFYAKDYRHVDEKAVSNIMNCFINSYSEDHS